MKSILLILAFLDCCFVASAQERSQPRNNANNRVGRNVMVIPAGLSKEDSLLVKDIIDSYDHLAIEAGMMFDKQIQEANNAITASKQKIVDLKKQQAALEGEIEKLNKLAQFRAAYRDSLIKVKNALTQSNTRNLNMKLIAVEKSIDSTGQLLISCVQLISKKNEEHKKLAQEQKMTLENINVLKNEIFNLEKQKQKMLAKIEEEKNKAIAEAIRLARGRMSADLKRFSNSTHQKINRWVIDSLSGSRRGN